MSLDFSAELDGLFYFMLWNISPSLSDIQDLLSPLNFPPDSVYSFPSFGVFYCKLFFFWKRNKTWQTKLIFFLFFPSTLFSYSEVVLPLICFPIFVCPHTVYVMLCFKISHTQNQDRSLLSLNIFEIYLFWHI